MKLGIEKINLYAGWFTTDAVELAVRHGKDAAYASDEIMVGARAVIPVYEDAVTLAVNAARGIVSADDIDHVELVIVASESGVDFGKPISSWVHRFCGLKENCRNFEVKHACYGATAALRMAMAMLQTSPRPGKKALVVSSDLTRPKLTEDFDYIGGGCAVALLVSDQPRVLEINPGDAGYWSSEITDTFRPTAGAEISDGFISVASYLDALDGAYEHFARVAKFESYDAAFKKHIYHMPFPGMAEQAHGSLLAGNGVMDKRAIRTSFEAKVLESLGIARRIGTAYGASNFVSLLSLLITATDLREGDPISLFAYGSGCQSEFSSARIGPLATDMARTLHIDEYLNRRRALSVKEYLENEEARANQIDQSDFNPSRKGLNGAYREFYEGKGLLVLSGVRDFRREYEWS